LREKKLKLNIFYNLWQPYRLEARRNQSKRGAKLRASLQILGGGAHHPSILFFYKI